MYEQIVSQSEASLRRTALLETGKIFMKYSSKEKNTRTPAEVERAAMRAVARKMREQVNFQLQRDAAIQERKEKDDKRYAAIARSKEELHGEQVARLAKHSQAVTGMLSQKKQQRRQQTQRLVQKIAEKAITSEEVKLKENQRKEQDRRQRLWKNPETKEPRPTFTAAEMRARHEQEKAEMLDHCKEALFNLERDMNGHELRRQLQEEKETCQGRRLFAEKLKKVDREMITRSTEVDSLTPKLLEGQTKAANNRLEELKTKQAKLSEQTSKRNAAMKRIDHQRQVEEMKAESRVDELQRESDRRARLASNLIDERVAVDPVKALFQQLCWSNAEDSMLRKKRESALRKERLEADLNLRMQRVEAKQRKQQALALRRGAVARQVMLEKHRNADKLYRLNITNNLKELEKQLDVANSDEEAAA
jgi:hypothetical protein